jgi:replicative superfamily II helicase/intein/homing endonuclease
MEIPKLVLKANSFENFNPMQEKCINKLEQSLVVSAPTASGKTIVAELFMLAQVLNENKKVIYTCPLRALASEHYKDFKKKYPDITFAVSTGDLDSSSSYLKKFDVIFTTYEKLASLLRHKTEWLERVGCVIVDEIHELDSDRGPVLEIALTQMRNMHKNLKVLGLSATIPNSKELSEWLNAMLVESDFRPVKLKEGVIYDNEIEFGDGSKENGNLESTIEQNLEKENQLLIFANSRKRAEGLAKKVSLKTKIKVEEKDKPTLNKISNSIKNTLEQPTEQCDSLGNCVTSGAAFHHAGLLPKQRELVEENFRKGLIKVICATPTLAAGVNTPADVVIIPSLYRYGNYGMELINVREYKQMCFPKDTLISTINGKETIGDIVKNKQKIKVKSFNAKTKTIELQPITKFYSQQTNKLINLNFSNFTQLNCTPDHPFCILQNSKFVWKKAKDLTQNDHILIEKQITKSKKSMFCYKLFPPNCFVLNQGQLIKDYCEKFNCTEKKLSDELNINYKRMYHIKTNNKSMPIKMFNFITTELNFNDKQKAQLLTHIKSKGGKTNIFPKKVTTDFLWLIGLIATDGNVNKQNKSGSDYTKIRIFNSNKKIINKAKKILNQFNLKPYEHIREDGNISLEIGGTLLASILENYFGIPPGNKTTILKTPKLLEDLDPKLIGAYLGGVFDGDGNYSKMKQPKGKQSFSHRILIVTASKEFAKGLAQLFYKLGIVITIEKHEPKNFEIKGKPVKFTKPLYNILFRKIEYIQQFHKYSIIIKAKFAINYSKYNNVNKRNLKNQHYSIIKLRNVNEIKKTVKVYNLQIKKNNNYFANDILVHNCGRSGRPKFSTQGTSLVQANSETQKDLYLEKYVNGSLEPITSKLSNSAILRMHVLALVATGDIYNDKSIWKFFEQTLYSKQSTSIIEIYEKVCDIIEELKEFEFVEEKGDYFVCTKIGKRVSDLFLDPKSAFELIGALKDKRNFKDFSYLFAWVNCTEFFPLFNYSKKLESVMWEEYNARMNELPYTKEHLLFDSAAVQKFFSALMMENWVNEKREQEIFTDFGLAPGLLFNKTRLIEWLAYSTIELAKVIGEPRHLVPAKKLSLRIKYGVKEQLLPLVELRGIGRARARKLFNSGINKPSDIRKNILKVEQILGKKVCDSLRKQLKIDSV